MFRDFCKIRPIKYRIIGSKDLLKSTTMLVLKVTREDQQKFFFQSLFKNIPKWAKWPKKERSKRRVIWGISIGIIIGHFEHQTLLKCKMTFKMRYFWRSFYTFFYTTFYTSFYTSFCTQFYTSNFFEVQKDVQKHI